MLLYYVLVFWPQGMWDLSFPTCKQLLIPFMIRTSVDPCVKHIFLHQIIPTLTPTSVFQNLEGEMAKLSLPSSPCPLHVFLAKVQKSNKMHEKWWDCWVIW